MPDRMLAINPGTASTSVDGIATREPAFGLPAWWITTEQRDRASTAGYTVVDPTTALSTHLSEMVRSFLPDLLSRQQTKELLDKVAQTSPRLVEDLVPKVLSTGDVQRVLRQLLRERVPIRDLTTILEALSDAAVVTKDPDMLTEAVRGQLGRAICRQYQSDRNELVTINLAPSLEERLMKSIVRTEQGAVLALEPLEAQNMATQDRPRPRAGRGTACASVYAGAAAAPVAPVLPRAAHDRRALARRSAAPRSHRPGRGARLIMETTRFRAQTVRRRGGGGLRRPRRRRRHRRHAAGRGARSARPDRPARGRGHRGGGARSVGPPTGPRHHRRCAVDRCGDAARGRRRRARASASGRASPQLGCSPATGPIRWSPSSSRPASIRTSPPASPAPCRAGRAGPRRRQPSKRPSRQNSAALCPATSRSRRSSCSSGRRAPARPPPSPRLRRASAPSAAAS